MVGAGIFTTSGFLVRDLGSPGRVLAAFAVGGFIALLGALSYGALARRLPESGGEYLFLSRTLHPSIGFTAGWLSLLVGFTAPLAAAAAAFGAYTDPWFPVLGFREIGTLLILVTAAIHAVHVAGVAILQNLAVGVKLLLAFGFAAWAFLQTPTPVSAGPFPANVDSFSWATFGVSLVWVSFSYSGWNAAVYVGGEVRHPGKNLPRALLFGTGVVVLLYLALNGAFFRAPVEELSGRLTVGRIAAEHLGGERAGDFLAALIALALFTSASALVMSGPRVYQKMARDGLFPNFLKGASGPPRAAILLQASLALLMLWGAAYDSLLTYIGFTLGLSTAATVVGLLWLRVREGAQAVPIPGGPIVPALFLLASTGLTVASLVQRPGESAWGLATILAGFLLWYLSATIRVNGALRRRTRGPLS